MFEKFFGKTQVAQQDRFFSEIEGYGDIKELLSKMIVSKESANVILKPVNSKLSSLWDFVSSLTMSSTVSNLRKICMT